MKLTLLTILLSCPAVFLSPIVGSVTENSEMTLFAQEWADYLASNNKFEHRSDDVLKQKGYDESLAWRSDESGTGREYVDQLYTKEAGTYQEKGFYNKEPTMEDLNSNTVGHFTAIVWKGTTQIGIGKASGNVVINYSPAGNGLDQYRANVFPPKA